ncbi:SH3 domain-containing protein [Robertmurraya beringensis]|uniref:SH3 domain-containing protein n=1 Tax=Robertmurraya beringensis TaxID=641660 RepID=A0ABV6KX08_9BACI
MKKLIASSVLATCSLLPFLVHAEELTLPSRMEAETKVEIRKGATTSYPLVTSLNEGQLVTVIDEYTNSSGETWYRVSTGNLQGWGLASSFAQNNSTLSIGQVATVNGDNVNVRKGATTAYTSIAKLSKGTKVTVIDQFKNSSGENWAKVKVGTITGWVIEDLLSSTTNTVVKPPTPTVIETKTVQTNQAQVKKGASQSYSTVATLTKAQKVSIIDSFKNSLGEQWYRVNLGSIQGWVIGTVFEIQSNETKTVQTNQAQVKKGASQSYSTVATLTKDQKVSVIDSFKNSSGEQWYRVDLGSIQGWVIGTAFEAQTVSPPTPSVDLPAIGATVYSSGETNVRRGATTAYASVATLATNQAVTVLDSFTHSTGESWLRVKVNSTLSGWIPANSVSTELKNTVVVGSTMYVGNYNTYLRSGASTQYKVKQTLAIKSKVTVLNEFVNSSKQSWLQVKTPTGVTGWVLKSDLVNSQSELKYVYALNKAVIRKGASSSYTVTATLKENDSLLILGTHNNWLNVETSNGVRGWVDQSLTSSVSLKRLTSPVIQTSGNEQYLTWKKPTDFSFSYSLLSERRLKLQGGITDIELPPTNPVGIQSIDTFTSGTEKTMVITFLPGYTFTLRDYSDRVVLKVAENGLKGKRIVIDPGHGGKDPGAIGPSGLKEKDVVLESALMLKTELERYGAIVTLTRSTDIFLELSERTAISNANNYDAFISLHTDAFSSTTKGTTTYLNTTVNFNGPRSRDLGNAIQENLISSLGTYDRGVKEQEFYVNRMNEIPSVLVELAFISNPNEEALLKSTAFKQKAVLGIRQGLEEYFTDF